MGGDAETTRQAVILPFPARGEAAARLRLQRALAGLDQAMTEQRQAVAAWRGALSELSRTVGGLHGSMQAHGRTLERLASEVAELQGEALRLRAWSEAALQVG